MKTRTTLTALVLALGLLAGGQAVSQAATWNGSANDNDWFTASNWTGTPPDAGNTAVISIVDTVNINAAGAQASALTISAAADLNIISDGLAAGGTSIITSAPTITQTDGAVTFSALYLRDNSQYDYNGGTLGMTTLLNIGNSGTFNHNSVNPLTVSGTMLVGESTTGNAFFNLGGNELTIGANLNIGVGSNTGTATFDFGNPATAEIIFTGGGSNGINVTGNNTFTVPAGLVEPLTIPGQSIIGGADGFSVFTQQGGDVDFDGTLYVSNLNDGKKDQYNFNGGTLQVQNLNVFQWGEFNHNNPGTVLDVVGSLALGNATGNAFFNLGGNEMTIGANLNIGAASNTGSATFNFGNPATAEIIFTGGGSNGINVTGNNTFTVPAGLVEPLTIPGLSIIGGSDGFSVFTQQGGDVDFDGFLYVSNSNDGKKDRYNFNGGTLQVQNMNVFQWGEFNHNNPGSALDIVGTLTLGNATGNAIFNLGGNQLDIGANLNIGVANNTGSATFNFGNPATAVLNIGNGLNIYGTNEFVVPAGLANPINIPSQSLVGWGDGESIYRQEGGTVSFNGTTYLSHTDNPGGQTDKMIVNGGTLNLNSAFNFNRRGLLQVNGGTFNRVGTLNIGAVAGYVSTYESTGGISNFSGTVTLDPVGDTEVDQFIVSGGTVNLNGATTDLVIARQGTASISGGTVNVGQNFNVGTLSGGFSSIVDQSGGTVNVTGNLNLATNAGASGDYNLTGGVLNVGGVVDLEGPGAVSFDLNGGTLAATTINDINNFFNWQSGTLTPGPLGTAATLTYNGSGIVMPAGGIVHFDLQAIGLAGGPNDLLVIQGDLTLGGSLTINALPGFEGTGSYPIIQVFGSLIGDEDDVAFPNDRYSMEFVDFGSFTQINLVIVPEPSSIVLGMGALGIVVMARRRRRRRQGAPRTS